MSFAGYAQIGDGEFWGVIRFRPGNVYAWHCDHVHGSRPAATACAYHAEGLARLAGLLPSGEQCRWNDPTTWAPKTRARLERRHYRL